MKLARYLLLSLIGLSLLGVAALAVLRHARRELLTPTVHGEPGRGSKLDLDLRVARQLREYRLYVPPAANGRAKVPVVIVLHGGGGSGVEAEDLTEMDPVADANGFLVAYPKGTEGLFGGSTWNGGDCCGKAMRRGIDDVRFISSLIDRLVVAHHADPGRVYVTGISNGAILAYRLACDLAGKVAAVAPVAGALMRQPCKPVRPVPIMIFHGTADRSIPWRGGTNKRSGQRRPFPSVRHSLTTWLQRDHCRDTAMVTYRRRAARCTGYHACARGSEVILCQIAGGGHTWPGGAPLGVRHFGITTEDISASSMMWKFFKRHPMPR